ncbi:hypothetical protein [Arthrobacter crystallopoietes]|uniref:hypothetical protein n=1 Tax=Crystallibacter crystallopoietes TaxID=37928 RepID=UPI001113981D|nr:hypothetical protein [Arthrobacter crystallopoietes]
MHLLEELAKRTGLDQHRVSAMTMAGWVPWLFDSLDLAPDAYETYVHQLSVLLPPKRRNIYTPRKWLPWLPEAGARRDARTAWSSAGATARLAIAGHRQLPSTLVPARNLRRTPS